MEKLKKQILAHSPNYTPETYAWYDIDEFGALVYEKDGCTVYDKAIQAALDKYKCVEISKRDTMYRLVHMLLLSNRAYSALTLQQV